MNFGVTVWAKQENVFRSTIRRVFVNVVNGKYFWNFIVSALFTPTRSLLQQPLLLCLRRSHGPFAHFYGARRFCAFCRARKFFALLGLALCDRVRFSTNRTNHFNPLGVIRRASLRYWLMGKEAFFRAIFLYLSKVRCNEEIFTATRTSHFNEWPFCFMGVNESAWSAFPVVVPTAIYERLAAAAGA